MDHWYRHRHQDRHRHRECGRHRYRHRYQSSGKPVPHYAVCTATTMHIVDARTPCLKLTKSSDLVRTRCELLSASRVHLLLWWGQPQSVGQLVVQPLPAEAGCLACKLPPLKQVTICACVWRRGVVPRRELAVARCAHVTSIDAYVVAHRNGLPAGCSVGRLSPHEAQVVRRRRRSTYQTERHILRRRAALPQWCTYHQAPCA